MQRKLIDIGRQMEKNQRTIDNISQKEDRVRQAVRSTALDVGALGSSLSGDRVDQSNMLDQLELMIKEYGLKVGRWLIKEGPCENLFFKDTMRGGWYKLAKTCRRETIYGEPQGVMLDITQSCTEASQPFVGCP